MLKKIVLLVLVMLVFAWLASFMALKYEQHEYAILSKGQQQAAELYYSDSVEPLPKQWVWREFVADSNVTLRTGYMDNRVARGTVIIVPGYTSPIEMQARAIKAFHAAGYKVAAIDYRGQGGSWRPLKNPEKGYVESYEQLGRDLANYARTVRIEGKPLYLHSISKGAHITMRMAALNMVDVDAIALVVPMIKILPNGVDISTLKSVSGLFTKFGLGAMYAPGQGDWPTPELKFGEANDCNANPKTAQSQSSLFAINPTLRVNGVTMRWLWESINSGEYLVSESFAKEMTLPIKVFNAGDERIVDAPAAESFCQGLTDCEVVQFPSARHCINREDLGVYDEILRQSVEFYQRH